MRHMVILLLKLFLNELIQKKENLGLTNFKGNYPTRSETEIAKNYLTEEELYFLNEYHLYSQKIIT